MNGTQKILALGSFGFAILTFFGTLGLIAGFTVAGIVTPAEFADANKIALGAVIGSFTASVAALTQ